MRATLSALLFLFLSAGCLYSYEFDRGRHDSCASSEECSSDHHCGGVQLGSFACDSDGYFDFSSGASRPPSGDASETEGYFMCEANVPLVFYCTPTDEVYCNRTSPCPGDERCLFDPGTQAAECRHVEPGFAVMDQCPSADCAGLCVLDATSSVAGVDANHVYICIE
jgi:hypothetical protein